MNKKSGFNIFGAGSPRRLRNVLLFPKIQFKYAYITSSAMVISMALILFNHRIMKHQILTALGKTNVPTEQLDDIFKYQFLTDIGIALISVACVFCLSIVVSHRFLGPSVGILKYFEKLKLRKPEVDVSGSPQSVQPLTQRSYDGLPHLVQFINDHEFTIREKAKSGTVDEK